MVKAAKNFTIGLDPDDFDNAAEARRSFKMGEEVPTDIAKQLPDDMILEKVAKKNPEALSREQLLVMAGLRSEDGDDGDSAEEGEFNEDQFREGLKEFKNKQDLVDWAKEAVGVELEKDDGSREELEDWITLAAQGIDPFEDDDEEEEQ